MTQTPYSGPAGMCFTPAELLIIWSALNLIPTAENADVREKVKLALTALVTPEGRYDSEN